MISAVLSFFRWATFLAFLVLNALVCSIAAWNMSFVSANTRPGMVDLFLIFVAAFGVVAILPIIVIELFRRNALSGRVWFELAWLVLFWTLYFAGAVAVTAILPGDLCDAPIVALNRDPCNSSRALIALSWMSTIILLVYFFTLAVIAIIHSKDDDKVWHAGVGSYNWFETKQCIRSSPSTPVLARFAKSGKAPSLAAPKPRRPPPIFVQHRAGFGSNYEIEHFPDPGLLEEKPLPPPVVPARPPVDVLALYPQAVQSSMREVENESSLPLNMFRAVTSKADTASQSEPIRNWPKQIGEERSSRAATSCLSTNVPAPSSRQQTSSLRPLMLGRSNSNGASVSARGQQPDKGKGRMSEEEMLRVQHQATMLERMNSKSSQNVASQPLASVPQTQLTPEQRPRRPSGPRTRSSSGEKHRPPPLDLSLSRPTSRR